EHAFRSLERDMYDMSKTRVAFMMCVTTGRRGAEKDIEVMNKWFDKYQFETPSGQSLEEFRDQINQSEDEISCCLITLMSHGRSHGLIQGKDGDKVDLDDIFALFNNIQCPKLQEKPKIFIIQACRGGPTVCIIKSSPVTSAVLCTLVLDSWIPAQFWSLNLKAASIENNTENMCSTQRGWQCLVLLHSDTWPVKDTPLQNAKMNLTYPPNPAEWWR
uniref:Caspase family p20 domain-containing protein n=1 Tax=Gopherus evgoodei TaxID=1825980 RepID=A0A8C4VVN5_9SAUR